MNGSLAGELRALVAEDLASEAGIGLRGDDRREFARQCIFEHLDVLVGADDGVFPGGGDRSDEQSVAQSVLDALFGMGGLQPLIDDDRHREHRCQRL